ncbi:phage tail protein I [Serratia marcescens]|uniref:phage tail protein I n=1 Tax=Serratia marcescens TaxID=615 RepID=UPI003D168868
MNNSLLPPSASCFMRSTEQAATRLDALPVDLNTLWSPDECPAALLPYLAWALSVDRWDKDWPEAAKREAIKASWAIHQKKGTIAALRRAVEPLGYLIQVIEWWQDGGPPGTFRVDIGVHETGITPAMYQELERVIADAKPASRHLTGLTLIQDIPGTLHIGAAALDGDIITVYPG